jgi:hypothetical protein
LLPVLLDDTTRRVSSCGADQICILPSHAIFVGRRQRLRTRNIVFWFNVLNNADSRSRLDIGHSDDITHEKIHLCFTRGFLQKDSASYYQVTPSRPGLAVISCASSQGSWGWNCASCRPQCVVQQTDHLVPKTDNSTFGLGYHLLGWVDAVSCFFARASSVQILCTCVQDYR